MALVAIEGVDGLGKSALADILQRRATELGLVAEIVVPEPSKSFGNYPDAIGWGMKFLREYVDNPARLTILDRFPVPSEYVYGRPHQIQEQDDDYLKILRDLSYYSHLRFVYIKPSPKLVSAVLYNTRGGAHDVQDVIRTDPMFNGDVHRWNRIAGLYDVWACHNNNLMLRLRRGLRTRWTEKTADGILRWMGYNVPVGGVSK